MNTQRYLMAAVAVFVTFGVVYVGAEFVFAEQFKSVAEAMNMRETERMAAWAGRILYTLVFCYIFLQGYENKGVGEGLRYGLLIGLLLVGLDIDWYGVSHAALNDAVAWWLTDLLAALAGGAVLATVYRPNGGSQATAE